MNMLTTPLAKASAAALLVLCATGCLAERPVEAASEPVWNSGDGPTQHSNDDAWQAWHAEASASKQQPVVISVEQRVR